MKLVALRSLAFFAVSLIPITADHLLELATLGEVVDSVVSALFFTLLFTTGCAVARARSAVSPAAEIARGALVAAVLWSSLWLGWSLALTLWPGLTAAWAFAAHGALMVLAGVISPRVTLPGASSDPAPHSA